MQRGQDLEYQLSKACEEAQISPKQLYLLGYITNLCSTQGKLLFQNNKQKSLTLDLNKQRNRMETDLPTQE